jgi:NAD-dependent DNA ligase/DNA polymerase/3'-5' exonuclease PolX
MKRYNEEFIDALNELEDIMLKKGEPFRAKAYRSASESIITYENDIHSASDLSDTPKIGPTIISKLNEYVETGKIKLLEDERNNPANQLAKVYGIGPKKAREFVEKGVTTVEGLRSRDDLTAAMKVGLRYFDDIEKRIPRSEIDSYKTEMDKIFAEVSPPESSFSIVGSYRRQAKTSGDIDIIVSNAANDRAAFEAFIDGLIAQKIIIEVLSRGKTKSLTVTKLPNKPARRVDFLYAPPDEYPFAILYFTGSKNFNTAQRLRALTLGYSLNEHGLYHMATGKKTTKVDHTFQSEDDIFKYMGMEYVEPDKRIDSRSITMRKPTTNVVLPKKKLKMANKTIKKKQTNHIEIFRTEGIGALKVLSEEELSNMIRKANDAYYCDTKPIMSDNEYDILRETTLSLFPNNEAALEGHTKCAIDKLKVTLPYEMWSMDKIKPDTNALETWKQKYDGPYVLSCKLDGVSGLYSTEGATPKLYTRGNGKIGQDVSHLIPYMKLPEEKGLVVRGEFIIDKSVFAEKYKANFANPRNFVAGAVNQKKIDGEKFADIDFVVYEVIKPMMSPSKQMAHLGDSVIMVENEAHDDVTNVALSELLVKWRKEHRYEIDGVICIDDKVYDRESGNPDHAFAFKMVLSDQKAEAKVLDVLWTPSKDGYLKPRVQIDPIVLGGVTISYATGFNGKFIKDNSIGVGALITLIRSGDVIPHITDVIQPAAAPKMPTQPYVWNETNVDIMLENKDDDDVVRTKTMTGFFRVLGVEGLSSGNAKRIIDAGFDTIPKIIKMTQEDFLSIDGFKDKLSAKIKGGIEAGLKRATLAELMQATNIFGRGFAVKRFQLILDEEPTILTGKLSDEDKIDRIKLISGMADKSSKKFVQFLPAFQEWLREADMEYKVGEMSVAVKDASHPLYGKKYVITGFRDSVLSDKLKKYGAKESSVVTKKTDYVIVKEKGFVNTKVEKAAELGVTIVTPLELLSVTN